MNCLEFHRAKLAEPRHLPPEAREHAAQCAGCRIFAAGVDDSERELEKAIAVPLPDGLADRVLLRVRSGRPAWRTWALAASLVLAVAIGAAAMLYDRAPAGPFAVHAIEHVAMEPASLTTVQGLAHDLGEVVRLAGGTLKQPLGEVRYVKLCPVEDGTGWHVVFATPEGLATLFIVPGKALSGAQQASTGQWNALARPVRSGYYVVVTPSSKKTAYVDRIIRERIDWST